MRWAACLATLALTIPAAAPGKAVFLPHRGAPVSLHGAGGSSIHSHGITVWTSGMPRSPFRVIGIIQDERTDKLLAGTAIRSAAVAALVRSHGGDAVLVHDVATRPVGIQPGGVGGVINTPSFSDQRAVVVSGVTTHLVVIKAL